MRPVNSIAVANKSSILDDADVALWVEGYRPVLPKFCADWGLPVPGLAFYGKDHNQKVDEEAAIVIVNSGDDPNAFGAHTILGVATWGYIDAALCSAYGEPVSRVFGHELFELVADPDVDRWAGPLPDGYHLAVEVCDPVQRDSRVVGAELFGRTGAVHIANWVLPAWFNPGVSGPFDALGQLTAPLTITDGGYYLKERDGVVMSAGQYRAKSFGRSFDRLGAGRAKAA